MLELAYIGVKLPILLDKRPIAVFVHGAKTLRMKRGKKVKDVAVASGLDRGTVAKIEQGISVSDASAWAVFNVLNEWHEKSLSEGIVSERVEGRKR